MGLRARILRVTAETGPRPRNVLSGLARGTEDFDATFRRMVARGELVMYGDKRGARYGTPRRREARR